MGVGKDVAGVDVTPPIWMTGAGHHVSGTGYAHNGDTLVFTSDTNAIFLLPVDKLQMLHYDTSVPGGRLYLYTQAAPWSA